MADYTAKDVQRLRQQTGAGMMDAKRALDENGGDFEAAAKWLREKLGFKVDERRGREATQGAVAVARSDGAAAAVSLRSETDFVAKNPDFKALAQEIAELVAAKGTDAAAERDDAVRDLAATLKENISLGDVRRVEAQPGQVIDTYLHVQGDRGVNGVVVALEGGEESLAREVAIHIAFARPAYLTREEVPAARVEEERETLRSVVRNEGKPEAQLDKIVEGRLNGFFKERVLLEQPYARDEKRTIAQLLGPARVVRFEQVVVGA